MGGLAGWGAGRCAPRAPAPAWLSLPPAGVGVGARALPGQSPADGRVVGGREAAQLSLAAPLAGGRASPTAPPPDPRAAAGARYPIPPRKKRGETKKEKKKKEKEKEMHNK